MRDDINDMFMEKNFEILKNKINLDINNNADSLNRTLSNFIDLKEIGLNRYIEDTYEDNGINYKKNKVEDFVSKEAEVLKEITLDRIKERKDKILNFFDKKVDYKNITDEYIENFHKYIDESTEELESNIDLKVREEICINFSIKASLLYKLPNEEVKDQIISYINDFYCDTIIDKIKSEVLLRNETLKNLSTEAFNRFKDINKKTVE